GLEDRRPQRAGRGGSVVAVVAGGRHIERSRYGPVLQPLQAGAEAWPAGGRAAGGGAAEAGGQGTEPAGNAHEAISFMKLARAIIKTTPHAAQAVVAWVLGPVGGMLGG